MANDSHSTTVPENTPQVEENCSPDNSSSEKLSSENGASSETASAPKINASMKRQLDYFQKSIRHMGRDMEEFRINLFALLALSDAQSRHFRDAVNLLSREVFTNFESAHEGQQEMADILSGKKELSG